MPFQKPILDPRARKNAPGEFVSLPDGIVHYQWGGPEAGPVVVLVHGFSVPFYIWDPTFAALTEAGYRVLRYDLYGRGYSDRPNTTYTLDLFVRQLRNLLNALEVAQPVALFGLSMGGPITTAFTARYPNRVQRLGLVDPVVLPLRSSWTARLLIAPVIGEIFFWAFGDWQIRGRLTADFEHPENFPEFPKKFLPQMKYRGFKRALLSTLRSGPVQDMRGEYQRVAKLHHPVLLIWGTNDQTVPYEQHKVILDIIPRTQFHPIPGIGHIPQYETPEAVNPILLAFLREN